MGTIRWFSPEVEALAPAWRETVVDTRVWLESDPDPTFVHGEARGFFVNCGTLDGYCKESGQQFRAAHEKIASDLAFDLALPVPPVVLTEPDARLCSVSSIPFPAAQKWQVVRPLTDLVATMTQRIATVSSAMVVFDTWVENADRIGHEGNVIISTALGQEPALAYIDYAWSFSHRWGDGLAPPVTNKIGPFPDMGLDCDIVRDTISAIEGLQEDRVRETVHRIPEQYLPAARRRTVADGLISRRAELRSFFQPHCGGSL